MISEKLKSYIEHEILPRYESFKDGHGTEHVSSVIRRCVFFAEHNENACSDIAYAAAAYHDIGYGTCPERHEEISAELMRDDKKLEAILGKERLEIAAQAVKDHRSSSGKPAQSIYGRMLRQADKDADIENALKRTYLYRKKRFPDWDINLIISDSMKLLASLYSPGGSRTFMEFNDPEYEAMLTEMTRLLSDPAIFRVRYMGIARTAQPETR